MPARREARRQRRCPDLLQLSAELPGLSLELRQMHRDEEVRIAVAVPCVPTTVRGVRDPGFAAVLDDLLES